MQLASDKDIIQAIANLEQSFGSKKFGAIQSQMIARHLRQLTPKECVWLVERIADTKRYAPTPQDVRETVKELLKERTGHTDAIIEVKPIGCSNCYETGYCFVRFEEVETICRCDCGYKKNSDDFLPTITAEMERMRFPVEKFKPNETDTNSKHPTSWETVRWWNMQKKIALQFWGTNDEFKGADF